jgi:predicted glycogen debranching enzyme
MQQTPEPGRHLALFCGDTIDFTLTLPYDAEGNAFLRTNIGHVATRRAEIIKQAYDGKARLAEDWFDIPMKRVDGRTFAINIPLWEVGHFAAKTCFLPAGKKEPLWPAGDNTGINIHPATYCCASSLYNAFVRQFGSRENVKLHSNPEMKKYVETLDSAGYAVIPPSGTFRDLLTQLDFIMGKLGCKIIMLLPIHPTPTVYGRMGRYGSPYAALDFFDVDPALCRFDRTATPMEQFLELVDAVHSRGGKLVLDIAINHTGWAAKLHTQHPEWIIRKDKIIQSPGAWGVVWEDLVALDHSKVELWRYLAEVFLEWCRRGIDGFRCDAGYMIPVSAWEFIVAKVRTQFPETLFLLEGLGGSIETTRALLNKGNLNMAYSELFQNYTKPQIESYLASTINISNSDGILMHFAETHDNNRLADTSPLYAKMRTILSALLSHNGAFAFANGVEWFATEKIDVHENSSLNWNAMQNQIETISRLNAILRVNPAFHSHSEIRIIPNANHNVLSAERISVDRNHSALILINLNTSNEENCEINCHALNKISYTTNLIDLIGGIEIIPHNTTKNSLTFSLKQGEALCLTNDRAMLSLLKKEEHNFINEPDIITLQRLNAKAAEMAASFNKLSGISAQTLKEMSVLLKKDPLNFMSLLLSHASYNKTIKVNLPDDTKRDLPVPAGNAICFLASCRFRLRIEDDKMILRQEDSIPCADAAQHFVLLSPLPQTEDIKHYKLTVWLYEKEKTIIHKGSILNLSNKEQLFLKTLFSYEELIESRRMFLSTNGIGGMLRMNVAFSQINSKYDAILAANLNPEYPVDRQIMFTRMRIWLVHHAYSQELTIDKMIHFSLEESNAGRWRYRIPFGHGNSVFFDIKAKMIKGKNAVEFIFQRWPSDASGNFLPDDEEIALIIRPDIEDRNMHFETKAYSGPEAHWKNAISPIQNGFEFHPVAERKLLVQLSDGSFTIEPEWYYMIFHIVEAERGLDPHSDLFSPGYFKCMLKGGNSVSMLAQALAFDEKPLPIPEEPPPPIELSPYLSKDDGESYQTAHHRKSELPHIKLSAITALENAMQQFIVKRGSGKTCIAGYPWFLDWGRDTLIACRGFLAAGMFGEVKEMLIEFAKYEEQGTLPNIIHGNTIGNRDTSDAPLWFIKVCSDFCNATYSREILQEKAGKRTIGEVVHSIINHYIAGTPNGIRIDEETGFVFSPAHFTWMDTNFPAATPREGFPIEIQALWLSAIEWCQKLQEKETKLDELALKIKKSIANLFWSAESEYFADCLLAAPGTKASKAIKDDALRPNQLFLITLTDMVDTAKAKKILEECSVLIIPGALRSLAPRKVKIPLPVYKDGVLLNNPQFPYFGRYEGDEDTRRKPAYHNGTGWVWLFPSFVEALYKVYGGTAKQSALSYMTIVEELFTKGCLGQLPEILDGDSPHLQRGCDAQAWSVTEFYRILKLLSV